MSYGWPVTPFGQQHSVRGFFGDPRIGSAGGTSFHFGIDVSVPDGTPVCTVATGTVHLDVAGGREGALAPFAKQHPPTVDRILAERNGHQLDPNALTGIVDLIAEAHDVTPIPPL